jgi:hypothetical protein
LVIRNLLESPQEALDLNLISLYVLTTRGDVRGIAAGRILTVAVVAPGFGVRAVQHEHLFRKTAMPCDLCDFRVTFGAKAEGWGLFGVAPYLMPPA